MFFSLLTNFFPFPYQYSSLSLHCVSSILLLFFSPLGHVDGFEKWLVGRLLLLFLSRTHSMPLPLTRTPKYHGYQFFFEFFAALGWCMAEDAMDGSSG